MSVEVRIRRWRARLLVAGLDSDVVDELEAHLLDSIDEANATDKDQALTLALAQLGDPLVAFAPPEKTVLSMFRVTLFMWCVAILTLLNEIFGLGNGKLDWIAVGVSAVLVMWSFKIRPGRNIWLITWTFVLALIGVGLVVTICAIVMYLFISSETSLLVMLTVALASLGLVIYQVPVISLAMGKTCYR